MEHGMIELTANERRERICELLSDRGDWTDRATIGNYLGQDGWQNEETNAILEQLVIEGILEKQIRTVKDTYYRGGKRSNAPKYPVFRMAQT